MLGAVVERRDALQGEQQRDRERHLVARVSRVPDPLLLVVVVEEADEEAAGLAVGAESSAASAARRSEDPADRLDVGELPLATPGSLKNSGKSRAASTPKPSRSDSVATDEIGDVVLVVVDLAEGEEVVLADA